MKKSTIIILILISLLVLAALISRACFTSFATSSTQISSGSLQISISLKDAPEAGISGLMDGGRSWLPGDHREALCTIKNVGNLPASWRLAVVSEGIPDPDLVDNIIFTWYQGDQTGGWKLVKSQRLKDLLVNDQNDHWLYDKDLFTNQVFQPLAAGAEQHLVLEVDFELSALEPLQNKKFEGKLLLQGTQVMEDQWSTATTVPLAFAGEEVNRN